MPYNSPRRHLLQSFSLVEDILERRRRESQPLSDEEYEALKHLCSMAPRQTHQPPLVPSTSSAVLTPSASIDYNYNNDNNTLKRTGSVAMMNASTASNLVSPVTATGGSLTKLQSDVVGSGVLQRSESFSSAAGRSAVAKLRKALGINNTLAISGMLERSREEAAALVNFSVTCSALASQPVKLIQQLVDHVTRLFKRREPTSPMIQDPSALKEAAAAATAPSFSSSTSSPAQRSEDGELGSSVNGGNSGSGSFVTVVIVEGDYLIDPINQTMVANNGRLEKLFGDRKSDMVFDARARSLYVVIAAESDAYGYLQIAGINDEKDVSEEKKQLTQATSCVAALTLRTAWQLEDLDFSQRKQSLLLRIANSIAGDAFASEAEVLTRLTVKARDLVDCSQSIFFKVDPSGNDAMELLFRGDLIKLERLENPGGSHIFVAAEAAGAASGGSGTIAGANTSGMLRRSAATGPIQFGQSLESMEDDALLSDEVQLASLAAEHIAHTIQVMQLHQGGSGLVEVQGGGGSSAGAGLLRGYTSGAAGSDIVTLNASSPRGPAVPASSSSRSMRGARSGPQFVLPPHLTKARSVRSMLGVPVLNDESRVIGVLVLINKNPKRTYGRMEVPQIFEQKDTDTLLQLGSLASIALANCRAASKLKSERRRREAVFNVVSHLNGECDIRDVNEICKFVMHGAKKLLNADRSTLFLIDEEHDELYSAVADSVGKVIRFPVGKGIAGRVALTGNAEVIRDAYSDDRFNQAVDKETGYRTLSILTLPVFTHGNVVAVAQLVNKLDHRGVPVPFNIDDQDTLNTFVMFAGIAIGNSKLLEFTVKAGREAMALTTGFDQLQGTESNLALSRTTTLSNMNLAAMLPAIPLEEIARVQQAMQTVKKLREADREKGGGNRFDPTSPQFDLFALRDEAPDTATGRDYASAIVCELFLTAGFDKIFKFEVDVLIAFVQQCRKMYRFVPYHNFFHAVDACQTIYTFMFSGGGRAQITELESFVMLVTALVHDLDHMGTNNSYHLKTDSPLGILSAVSGNDSVLEVHHATLAISILGGPDCNIFGGLSKADAAVAYRMMLSSVLATDMARHGELMKSWETMCSDGYDREKEAHRQLTMHMLMKSADISNVTKPFHISRQWAVAVTEEFYQQGDRERAKGLQVVAMNDRSLGTELAKGQLGFINFVASKHFQAMTSGVLKGMSWALEQLNKNKKQWQDTLDAAGESH